MQNPIEALESKLAEVKKELRHDVAVDLVRLGVTAALGWLNAEDPDRSAKYKTAIDAIE